MNFDLDLELRLAVFEHVHRLRDAGGGVISWRALNEGIVFRGRRVPIWNYQKGIFRPALLRESGAALSVQTSFDSPYDDRWHPDDDRLVYRYRGTDPDHPDNRALRRALELQRPVLYLVAVKKGVYQPVFPCYVVGDVPERLTFFLMADAEGFVSPAGDDADTSFPRKAYITREVMASSGVWRRRHIAHCSRIRRQHQRAETLLVQPDDAAHILPDRDERGRPEVPNGLSLCRIHHGAYDIGILGVDPDYHIHLRRDVLDELDGPMLKHGLQELNGERIELPRRERDRPNREFLAERFERFRVA